MIILIDAYNVLKQASSAAHISSEQRAAFIKKLSQYATLKGHTIIAVFDAGESSRPYEEKRGAVRIIYSGHATNADTIIKQLCHQFKQLQVVVVSSDREICSYASFYGIACIEATALYELLQGAEQEDPVYQERVRGQAQKRAGYESSSELDALMQESSQSVMMKQEDQTQQRRSPAKTESKFEKKIKKLVDKL